MKDITTFIKEALNAKSAQVNEGLKDIQVPRKGSYIYILKDGDAKVKKVRIENVIKRPMGKGYDKSFTYVAELADNEYGVKDYYKYRFSGINYKPKAVEVQRYDDGNTYYFGIDAKSINEFVQADAGKKLEGILKRIDDLETQLAEANEKKAKLEEKLNSEITESLLEGKETFVKFYLFGDDTSKTMEKISAAAQAVGIYYEKSNDTSFKLKLKPGQDWSKIKSILEDTINDIPEDKKEEAEDVINKLKTSIEKADDAVKSEENDEEKNKEEE